MVSFDTKPDKATETFDAVLREIALLREKGISDDELRKARKQALSSQFSTFSDMRGQASDLATNWLLTRNLDYTRDYVDAVQRVEKEAVQEAAVKYLGPERFTRVALLPKDREKARVVKPAAKRSEEIRKITLENGLTVLLLQDKRVPFVQASGVFEGGLLAETPHNNGVTRLLPTAHERHPETLRQALALEIESVGGGIGASFGNNSFGVSVSAMRTDLPLVVDLLGETLLEPAFLESVVEREKQFQLTQIKEELDRPFTVAMREMRRHLYGTHPYGLQGSGTEESVLSLHRDSLIDLHGRLVRGGNGVVGVFGDLDPDRAEDLIRARFAENLAVGSPGVCNPVRSCPAAELRRTLTDLAHEKEQAVLLIGYCTVHLTHADNPALEMIDEACSDMASRLFIRIREELGLAYSVGASRMTGTRTGFLVFYASTSPEKLDLVAGGNAQRNRTHGPGRP